MIRDTDECIYANGNNYTKNKQRPIRDLRPRLRPALSFFYLVHSTADLAESHEGGCSSLPLVWNADRGNRLSARRNYLRLYKLVFH